MAKLDEESAQLHKKQVVMAQELKAALSELEVVKAAKFEPYLQSSPTPSEQVLCKPYTSSNLFYLYISLGLYCHSINR